MYDAKANGNRLRNLRGKKTLEEVASEINISVSALAMYERGERNPRDEVKLAFAKYYAVPVTDIFFAS